RRVRHPSAVGGECGIAFVEWRLQERKRLSVAEERQDPQIQSSLGSCDPKQNEPSVWRPAQWIFVKAVRQQFRLGAGAAGCLLIQVEMALAARVEDDAA